jgi:hypothetical protein
VDASRKDSHWPFLPSGPLCSPSWALTRDPPALDSQVLRLQVWATMPCCHRNLEQNGSLLRWAPLCIIRPLTTMVSLHLYPSACISANYITSLSYSFLISKLVCQCLLCGVAVDIKIRKPMQIAFHGACVLLLVPTSIVPSSFIHPTHIYYMLSIYQTFFQVLGTKQSIKQAPILVFRELTS